MPNTSVGNQAAIVEDLIPTAEVAKLWRCTVRTVHRKVARGELVPALKIPGATGAYLFHRADVEQDAA